MRHHHLVAMLLVLLFAFTGWTQPVRILATGDMHGWLEAQSVNNQSLGGAAEMLAYWQRVEHYTPERFFLLCAGDTATGPALDTVFNNEPMIETMNLMGYDACVLGNHEFDYGLPALARWRREAHFPFIAANLFAPDGKLADFPPFYLHEKSGVKVAAIGLTVQNLAAIANTGGYTAHDYAETLRQWVPRARAQGAQVVIVLAHVPMADLIVLAKATADLHIPLMLGGHSHELGQIKIGDTWIVNSGEWWRAYSRIDLDYDPPSGKTVVLSARQVWLQQRKSFPDETVQHEIADWRSSMKTEFSLLVGYTATGLTRPHEIYNFITDCWRAGDPLADIALSNNNGFRQDIPAGIISKSVIWGVMPFRNSLLRVKLTGKQLLAYLPQKGEFIGMSGLRRKAGQYLLVKTGQPVDPTAYYKVLLNDYMYNTSAQLKAADPAPMVVFGDWRQPVLRWLATHPTSKKTPLESLTDRQARVD